MNFPACRQRELKYSAPRSIGLCPQPAAVGGDDGPANRESHSDSSILGGVEGRENLLETLRIESRP